MAKSSVAQTSKRVARSLKAQAVTLGGSLAAMWAVFGVNVLLGGFLNTFGIVPRTQAGLAGILFAPLLHANMTHLLANTVPFALFGWLVMLRDRRHFVPVLIASVLGSGLCSWLLGAPHSIHIGASGVVFGFLGFLLVAGWYARSVASIALSVGVAVLWGGTIAGVLPGTPGVSWQGHLGGFIGGVLAARWIHGKR